jgi:hypothetical protein
MPRIYQYLQKESTDIVTGPEGLGRKTFKNKLNAIRGWARRNAAEDSDGSKGEFNGRAILPEI